MTYKQSMTKILLISATSNNNLKLTEAIHHLIEAERIPSELINIENYEIPLYTSLEHKNGIPSEVGLLTQKFIDAKAFIFCAPEYNGSIPPVLTNLIAWISVSTNSWREVFDGKVGLLATHSGGQGTNILRSMRIQLEHLGVLILPRTIVVNKHSEFNVESSRSKIKQLINYI